MTANGSNVVYADVRRHVSSDTAWIMDSLRASSYSSVDQFGHKLDPSLSLHIHNESCLLPPPFFILGVMKGNVIKFIMFRFIDRNLHFLSILYYSFYQVR